jgi:protein-arginine kinase activator protein McsA
LSALQKKLAKTIQEENFESAAVLRDEINQLTERSSHTRLSR